MKTIALADHLTREEIERQYRQTKDRVERSRWQVIWLIAQGYSRVEIAKITGYTASWITAIIKRYNAQGAAGVEDHRHRHPGPASLLTPALGEELAAALEGQAPDGGLWTGPKVAQWMSEKLNRPIYPVRGWEALRALEYRLLSPRPRHRNADPDAQEHFKKNPS